MNCSLANQDKVMSRMEWFRDLKLIFNKLLAGEDLLAPVEKSLLLKELAIRSNKLELKDPFEYYAKSKVQAFSLGQIREHVSSLDESGVNFDQLIDSLIYLSIEKKRKEKKVAETNPVKPVVLNPKTCEITAFNLKETGKEYQHVIAKPFKQSELLDLSFQKLENYPDLHSYSGLLQLSLTGNNLAHTIYRFPQCLQALNLSSNRISQLKLESPLENLAILNVTSNQISSICNINNAKSLKELYIANNCVTGLNMLCHLTALVLVDCSHNEIETFEDIAGLVISKRIGVLKLRGNPISSKLNYEQVVNSILPRIYCLDPLNIIELSTFKSLGPMIFLPIKDILEQADEKPRALSSIKSEVSFQVQKKKSTGNIFSPEASHRKVTKLSATPVCKKNYLKMQRSASQSRVVLASTAKTEINVVENEEITKKQEFMHSGNMIDMAERRIKIYQSDRSRSNISVISNESIQNVKKIQYGNPIAAMMIGPPAVSQAKSRLPSRSPACLSLDLSKKRRYK